MKLEGFIIGREVLKSIEKTENKNSAETPHQAKPLSASSCVDERGRRAEAGAEQILAEQRFRRLLQNRQKAQPHQRGDRAAQWDFYF